MKKHRTFMHALIICTAWLSFVASMWAMAIIAGITTGNMAWMSVIWLLITIFSAAVSGDVLENDDN